MSVFDWIIPSNKEQTIAFFISAPASHPHIDPASRPLFSRFLPSSVPSSPGLPLPFPLPLYKRESDWMGIQPIEDPDRYIHVFPAKLLVGVQIENEITRRGPHWRIRSGGLLVWKKKSPDLSWHLCNLVVEEEAFLKRFVKGHISHIHCIYQNILPYNYSLGKSSNHSHPSFTNQGQTRVSLWQLIKKNNNNNTIIHII